MFQQIAGAYAVLCDDKRRELYDRTGETEHDAQFEEAYEYYRFLFPKIGVSDIVEFEKRYRYGDMETEDLVNYYVTSKGDMRALLESIPLSSNEDVERFIQFYDAKIGSAELTSYARYK
jgi:DnaJ family protein C protein 9